MEHEAYEIREDGKIIKRLSTGVKVTIAPLDCVRELIDTVKYLRTTQHEVNLHWVKLCHGINRLHKEVLGVPMDEGGHITDAIEAVIDKVTQAMSRP